MRVRHVSLLVIVLWTWARPADAVDFAAIEIVPGNGTSPRVTIPEGQSTVADESLETEGFFVDPGAITGAFPIRVGDDWNDDASNGVLFGYVYEIGRTLGAETIYATASTIRDTRGGAGGLSLSARRAGEVPPESPVNGNAPVNANLVAAYFPFIQGWLGGTALSSDDATFDKFVGSPELSLKNVEAGFWEEGPHVVTIPGVQDTRRQGFLFATGDTSENIVALVSPTTDGSAITVSTIDNSKNGGPGTPGSFRFSPFSFLFIPRGTPNMTMGRIHPGDGPDVQPSALISSGGDFTISREAAGLYRLSIAGGSPQQGALLVSPHGASDGDGGRSDDNIVQYEPDGNDWLIISQDLPTLDGTGQDAAGSLTYFDFAYLPYDSPPRAPGPVLPLESLTNFSTNRVFAYGAQVNQQNETKAPGAMYQVLTGGPSDLAVRPLGRRGDLTLAVDGGFVSMDEGVLMPTVSEGFRDNGRVDGYGVISAGEFDGELQVHTASATPTFVYPEHNVNYSAAFFGTDSGFEFGVNIPIDEGSLELSVDGVTDSGSEGVLLVAPFGKVEQFATAGPLPDGSGWDIRLRDSDTSPTDGGVNFVYLPFETNNLIAGQIDVGGDALASTGDSDFTMTKEDIGTYRLSIPGKSPDTGMLLLTGMGPTSGMENEDNYLVYEHDGDDFLILGLDMVTLEQAGMGESVGPEDTSFAFAYIDFENPPTVGPAALDIDSLCLAIQQSSNAALFDINGDGMVDHADLVSYLESEQRLLGDADFDGEVQFPDLVALASNFGQTGKTWSDADFDCEGQVQFPDLVVLAENFGQSAVGQAQVANVPEPSLSLWFISCAVFFLLTARRWAPSV